MKELCGLLEIPRSTYYRWKKKDWDTKDEVEQAMIVVCKKHKRRYGYRRVTDTLRKLLKARINHKRVLRLMKANNLLSKAKRAKKVYLTGQEAIVAENRIQRNFKATAPNQKWFTDVLYLPFGDQMLYFSSIFDTFNAKLSATKSAYDKI